MPDDEDTGNSLHRYIELDWILSVFIRNRIVLDQALIKMGMNGMFEPIETDATLLLLAGVVFVWGSYDGIDV